MRCIHARLKQLINEHIQRLHLVIHLGLDLTLWRTLFSLTKRTKEKNERKE